MYRVEVYHHDKNWRNGDLEDKWELIAKETFKARKNAKNYIEKELNGKKNVLRHYHLGDNTSYCYYYTGVTWQHENSGETMEEYYMYVLKKVKLK